VMLRLVLICLEGGGSQWAKLVAVTFGAEH